MSDTKTYTEREVIEMQREAFKYGVSHGQNYPCLTYKECEGASERMYPLPKVTRPRVVRDEWDCEWRSLGGKMEFRLFGCREWKASVDYGSVDITPSRVGIWADLLANPTEEVDA